MPIWPNTEYINVRYERAKNDEPTKEERKKSA